ncbi:MAG: dihydroorotase [Prevotellaceae bacterium]|jgi:dihydroorotase|nr:dihydroorotase [Prevotellaceae bacterium]
MNTIIKNANILNEGKIFEGNVWIENEIIKKIFSKDSDTVDVPAETFHTVDARNKLLMPGIIDDQVHFRDPGLTYKGDIFSESRAAAAGGVTSFMDMPNTSPPTLNAGLLDEKYNTASRNSLINYSFYLGASNDNIDEIRKIDPKAVCGIKVFMGSSTGNMLVDSEDALSAIFSESPVIVAVHCEDENTVRQNTASYRQKFGEDIQTSCHPEIRSAEACYRSSAKAVELAVKHNTKLHVLHLSTAKELDLFENSSELRLPKITAEACVHHLWFSDADYQSLGNRIKCNPAIKSANDRDALRAAVKNGKITVVATDHAPHTASEKQKKYFGAPSGLPLIQHSLSAMLEMHLQGVFSLFDIVDRMCHAPARLFDIRKRGYIREGYYADLALIDMNAGYSPCENNILYKCGWSPFEGVNFSTAVEKTWVNGSIVFDKGQIIEKQCAKRLEFDR